MMHKKLGDAVKAGEPLATLYVNTEAPEEVQAQVLNSFTIGETKPELPPLIHEVIR